MSLDSWQGFSIFLALLVILLQVLFGGYYYGRVASCGAGNTRHNRAVLLFEGIFWPMSALSNVSYMMIFMMSVSQHALISLRSIDGYEFF
jgi:hypothetical protein